MGRLDGKVCVITGAGGGMGREAAIVFTAEGAKVCVADLDLGLAEETVSLCDGDAFAFARERRRRGRRPRDVRGHRGALRRHRRPLQQRGHLARRRRLRPRHERRGVAAGAGRQHEGRLPLLQARDPVPARAGRRLGDQRRVVRRDSRRRDLADLVHGVEGRRAGDVEGARRAVRAPGRARQRALPGAGRDAAPPRDLRRRSCRVRAPPGALADGPAREAARDRERGALPRERRVLVRQRRRVRRGRRPHGRLRHAAR